MAWASPNWKELGIKSPHETQSTSRYDLRLLCFVEAKWFVHGCAHVFHFQRVGADGWTVSNGEDMPVDDSRFLDVMKKLGLMRDS
jgi:hypothetical protein